MIQSTSRRAQSATTQLRNSGGVKFSDGYYVLTTLVDTSAVGAAGLNELEQIVKLLSACGYGPDRIVFDTGVDEGSEVVGELLPEVGEEVECALGFAPGLLVHLCHGSVAVAAGVDAIVTRDPNGFTASPIPICTPADLASLLSVPKTP